MNINGLNQEAFNGSTKSDHLEQLHKICTLARQDVMNLSEEKSASDERKIFSEANNNEPQYRTAVASSLPFLR